MHSGTGKLLRSTLWALLASAACSADRGSTQSPVAVNITPTTGSAGQGQANLPPTVPSTKPEPPVPSDHLVPTATAPEPYRTESRRACVKDGDCFPGFCDWGFCGNPGTPINYGRECTPPAPEPDGPLPPPPPGGMWGPKAFSDEDTCDGYLCIRGRCRSCLMNSECAGGMTCGHADGFPGKMCGDYTFEPSDPSTAQPPPLPFPSGTLPPRPPGQQILQTIP